MQIFRKPREIWPEQWRGQWVSGGYDHKRLEVRSAQGRCAIPPKLAVPAPTGVYITTKKRFFLPFFFAEKIRFTPLASAIDLLRFSLRTQAFLFVGTTFAGGTHLPGNLLSPSRGIRLSPDPVLLFPYLLVSSLPLRYPHHLC